MTQRKNEGKQKMLFGDAAKQWLSLVQVNMKPATLVRYRNDLQNHILPAFEQYNVEDVTTFLVEQFALEKIRSGRCDGNGGLSVKTVKDMVCVTGEVLQYARKRGFSSPCHVRDIRLKYSDPHAAAITRENQLHLEQYLLCNADLKNMGVLLSLYMGMRIGEVCALRWENIHLSDKVIDIQNTMQRIQIFPENMADGIDAPRPRRTKVIITTPKSSAGNREIPIPQFLAELLSQCIDTSPQNFFLTNDPHKFIEPRALQRHFKRVLNINNIPYVNFHRLRHTFATRCIEEGFDMKSLSEILGHTSVSLTMNRYVHTSMEQKRKNMLKLDAPFSNIS